MRQYIKEIYREIEVCPDCDIPMSVDKSVVLATYPAQYIWTCPNCNKTTTSLLDGQPQFIFRDCVDET